MACTPLVPFLARTTLSVDERYMYFVPAMVKPFIANCSVLLYLAIMPLSSSGVTCKKEEEHEDKKAWPQRESLLKFYSLEFDRWTLNRRRKLSRD